MPTVSAANLTRLRFTKHATLLRLAVYAPAAIWTAQVDGAQTTGDTTITVKNVVQVRAPAEHFQVIIGSTAGGREYGEARWKSYAAPTLTISAHNCELPDNAYITVLEEIKPQAIYATMDATDVVYEDGTKAYTDENFRYHPIARIGPPAVAYRDETTGIATVNFYGDCSAFGAALLSHAWDFKDGNPAASAIEGTAVAPIAVEFATAGARYISHTVTDTSAKTHTAYRPVFIFDRHSGTLPYTQIEVDGMEGDVESGGWSCNVTVHTAAGSDAFPPQALCVIFAEDWFGSEEVSIGGAWTYRENIVMVGYIRRGTVRKDWAHNVVEFTVEGIGCLLNNIPGNALSLESAAVPTGWHQLSSLNPVHAAYHLLTEHSTVDHICDLGLITPFYYMDFFDITEVPMLQQLSQEIAGCVRGRVGSNAQGMLWFETNPQLQPLADRAATHTVVMSTTFTDIRGEISFDAEEMEKQVTQVDFASEESDGDPIFSLAPANPWVQGRWERVDGIRADSQNESNILSGLWEGYLNNQYANVSVNWRGNYRIFDVFPSEALNVNITAAQNKRGIVWTDQRCWTKRVMYEYRNTHLIVSSVIEKDAYGAPGKTGEYPEEPPDIVIPPPIVLPPIVPVPDPDPPTGDGSRCYVGTDGGVAYCDNFLTAPTWTAVNGGLAGDALNVYKFYFDPWSSDGVKLTGAYIATEDGIYKNTNLPVGNWAQVLSKAGALALSLYGTVATFHNYLVLPINVENYVGAWVACGDGLGGSDRYYYFYSTDGGANWSCNTTNWVLGWINETTWGYNRFQPFPSHKTANTLYTVATSGNWWGADGGEQWRVLRSLDGGASWAIWKAWCFSAAENDPDIVIMPFCNGSAVPYANDLKAWRIRSDNIEYTTNFPAYAIFNVSDWTISYTVPDHREFRDFDMCTWDEDYIYALGPGGAAQDRVVYTNNSGTAWSVYTFADGFDNFICLSCLPYNALFCAVAGWDDSLPAPNLPIVFLTLDGGATFNDRTGDLATVLATATQANSIVPDWIKVT